MIELNIKCVASEHYGLSPINPATVVDILIDTFGRDFWFRYNPDTRNIVARGHYFKQESIYRIADALQQDFIAWYDSKTGNGTLIGPRADEWGKFALGFFERF